MAIQDMTHEPVDKVKDGKMHVLEYALLSLTYYNSTVSHCAN